ncbi:hypothetical protein DRH13_00040 [Candidatus Woesebacteria bacterium]|nr:MAG: hypothetical protein DRH13_00040 [Candidatus Woesebacteria bacterium]
MKELSRMRAAGFGAVHLSSTDEEETILSIVSSLKGPKYIYTAASGLVEVLKGKRKDLNHTLDQIEPSYFLVNIDHALEDLKENAILILVDVWPWVNNDPLIRRSLVEAAQRAKSEGWFIIILDSQSAPHKDLASRFSSLTFPLPDYEASLSILEEMCREQKIKIKDPDMAVSYLLGLNGNQQRDSVSLAIIEALKDKKDTISPDTLRKYKEKEIEKTNFLKISEPSKRFEDLIGHEALKKFLAARKMGFSASARDQGLPPPKGMMMVGPPGTGKSRFAEATAGEWRVPYLKLDFSALFGSYLGESESRLSKALELAEKCAPCVLLVDEIERAFNKGGERDGGTSERVTGKMLNWMAEKTASVFVIFTANNAHNLPAALIRKGRIDEIFSLDFPSQEEREKIWEYYLRGITIEGVNAIYSLAQKSEGFSPAEIEGVVVAARYSSFFQETPLNLSHLYEEIGKTTPISSSMKPQIDKMRSWANTFATQTT